MNEKELFFQDKKACRGPLTRVAGNTEEKSLREIDELYGAADVLSIRNAEKHRRILLLMSFAGTLLTLSFLLYDEAELYGLILACGVLILCLVLIRRVSDRLDCHRKYLQYRVLAECLRVEYFLCLAAVKTKVTEILPWSLREGIPWIAEVLGELPAEEVTEKRPIKDCWVADQKKYHEEALAKAERKAKRDSVVSKAVLIVTIASYLAALAFEGLVLFKGTGALNADIVRAVLKIVLGTMSAVTLFFGSFYGKMSLSNVIEDHKRMISLYETALERIRTEGESEELIRFLAREYLNENSAWYAYQSKNTPDIVI